MFTAAAHHIICVDAGLVFLDCTFCLVFVLVSALSVFIFGQKQVVVLKTNVSVLGQLSLSEMDIQG